MDQGVYAIINGMRESENFSWTSNQLAAACPHCGRAFLLPRDQFPLLCPHCFLAQLEEMGGDDVPELRPPELIIPPALTSQQVAQTVQNFARGIWFAPKDLRPQHLQQRLRLLYLPVWLVDSDVLAQWRAEMGFNYQVVSHQERFANGKWRTQEVKETRIRWEPRLGQLQRRYDNVAAPALEEQADLEKQLGRYDLQKSQTYQPGAAANALIRLPNRPPQDAWPEAEPTFLQQARQECRLAAQADHIRDFHWSSRYANQHWTHLLQPVYVTHYFDDSQQPHPLLINGQTGQAYGRRRASRQRAMTSVIMIGLVAVLCWGLGFAAALLSLYGEGALLTLGGILIFTGLCIAACALIPLFVVWYFNWQEKRKAEG